MTDKSSKTSHLEEEVRELRSILGVAQAVVSSLDLDAVLATILDSAMSILDTPAGAVALYDEKRGEMEFHAQAGFKSPFFQGGRWEVWPGSLAERILQGNEPFVVEDTRKITLHLNSLVVDEGVRAIVGVPLKIQHKIVGVLFLDDFAPRTFPEARLRPLAILASFAAMSIDNARLHEQTLRLARTDGLTGLFNHRQFKQVFRDELVRASRYENPLALVMFDVDDFKGFNDTYGHPEGDKVLIDVARILKGALRQCDILFRYGGEEFIAVLPQTGLDEALVVAERARQAIESQTLASDGAVAGRGVTVSSGVAAYPRDGRDLDSLLKITDDLLYQAKKQGKNKVYHRHAHP